MHVESIGCRNVPHIYYSFAVNRVKERSWLLLLLLLLWLLWKNRRKRDL